MSKLNKNRIRTKPPETTKDGLLKKDRKARHQPILIEDLATMEDLNEQLVVEMLSKRFMRQVGRVFLVNPVSLSHSQV